MQPMITLEDVVNILNVSERTVHRLVTDDHLKAYMVGGQLRFIQDDVIEYIKSNQVTAKAVQPQTRQRQPTEEIRAWMFQAKPDNWHPEKSLAEGNTEKFAVRQYGKRMQIGDNVGIWLSGPNAGLYVLGKLISEPFDLPPEDPFGPQGVKFQVTKILSRPVFRRDLIDHPVLKNMLIMRMFFKTNFPITDEEWMELQKLTA
jgi:excisionase family DNA binding protein